MSVATVYSRTAEVENKPHTSPSQPALVSQTPMTTASPITTTSTITSPRLLQQLLSQPTLPSASSPGQGNSNDDNITPVSAGENTFDSYSFLSRFDRYRNYHSQYSLVIRQQPVQARQSGGREKDRRPIDPPPIVQLINLNDTPDDIYLQNPYLFVYVSLIDPLGESRKENNNGNNDTVNGQTTSMSSSGTSSGGSVGRVIGTTTNTTRVGSDNNSNGLDGTSQTPSSSALSHNGSDTDTATIDAELRALPIISKGLCGQLVSSLHRLKDITNEDAGFFIFPDTSARLEGKFRLRFSLYEIRGTQSVRLCSVHSDLFTVYPPRSFPGMSESTFLSRSFSDQGVRIRIRKESRYITRTSMKRSASAMSIVKQSAVQATADMISLNKRRMIEMNTVPMSSASPPMYNRSHNSYGSNSSGNPPPSHNPHEMSYPHPHYPHRPAVPQVSYSPSYYQSPPPPPPHHIAPPPPPSHYYEQAPPIGGASYPSHMPGYPHQHSISGDQVAHHQRYDTPVYNRPTGTSMNTAATSTPGYLSPRSHPNQQYYPGSKPLTSAAVAAATPLPHEHTDPMTRRMSYSGVSPPAVPSHESVNSYYYTHATTNSPANYHHPSSQSISTCGDPHCQNPHCGATMIITGVSPPNPPNVYKQSLPSSQPQPQSHYIHHHRQPSTTITATTTSSTHAYPSRGADRSTEYHYPVSSGSNLQLSSSTAVNTARMPTPTSLSSPTISNSYTNGNHSNVPPHHVDGSYRMTDQVYGGDRVPPPPSSAYGHHRTPSTSSTRPSGNPMQMQAYATAYPHPYDAVSTTDPALVTSCSNSMLKHIGAQVSVPPPSTSSYMNGQPTTVPTPTNMNSPIAYRPSIPRTNSSH